jgi:hypothetical protein
MAAETMGVMEEKERGRLKWSVRKWGGKFVFYRPKMELMGVH